MRPDVALYRAMDGQDIERVLFVPKIWVDLAAALVGVDLVDIIEDPLLAMRVLVDAGLLVGADAVRQFIFPPRQVEHDGEAVFEIDGQGRRIGEIDMAGGLATHLYDPEHFRLEDPFFIAHQTCWKTEEPLVQNLEDVRRIAVPDKDYYEATGYGDRLRAMLAYAGDRIALIGDCDCATLAFYAGFRGVQQAMLDFYMESPVAACGDGKGRRALDRAGQIQH